MVNRSDMPEVDITEEEYSGPSALIASLGHGVVQHLAWAMTALGAAGAFAMVAPKLTANMLNCTRKYASKLREHPQEGFISGAKHYTGAIIHGLVGTGDGWLGTTTIKTKYGTHLDHQYQEWLDHTVMNKEHGFGHWFVSHTFGLLPYVGKRLEAWLKTAGHATDGMGERITNALTFGGAFGALGYIGGWVEALVVGTRHGDKPRQQLLRAQQEIKDTRVLNSDLEKKYVALQEENLDLKATLAHAQHDELRVAKDTPTVTQEGEHTAQHHAEKRDPIKPPEHDWASDIAAQKAAAAQQETAIS